MKRITECLGKIKGTIDPDYLERIKVAFETSSDENPEAMAVMLVLDEHASWRDGLIAAVLEQHPMGPKPEAPSAPAKTNSSEAPKNAEQPAAETPAPESAGAGAPVAPPAPTADSVLSLIRRYEKAASFQTGTVTSIPTLLEGITRPTAENVAALETEVKKFEADVEAARIAKARARAVTTAKRAEEKKRAEEIADAQKADRAAKRMEELAARERLRIPPSDAEITPATDAAAALEFSKKVNRSFGESVLADMLAGKMPVHMEEGDVTPVQAHAIFVGAKGLITNPEFASQLEQRIDELVAQQKAAADQVAAPVPTVATEPAAAPAPTVDVSAPVTPPPVATSFAPPPVLDKPVTVVDTEEAAIASTTTDHEGNRAKSREAILWAVPDGTYVVTSLQDRRGYNKGILSVSTGKVEMGGITVAGLAKGGRGGGKKVISADGNMPALISDVVAAGFKPVAKLRFDGEPGTVHARFATNADVEKWLDSAPKPAAKPSNAEVKVAAKAQKDVAEVTALSPELAAQRAKVIERAEASKQQRTPTGRESYGDKAVAAAEALEGPAKGSGYANKSTVVDEGGNTPHVEAELTKARFMYGIGPWAIRVKQSKKKPKVLLTIVRNEGETLKDLKARIGTAANDAAKAHDSAEIQVTDGKGRVQYKLALKRVELTEAKASEVKAKSTATNDEKVAAVLAMRTEKKGDAYLQEFVAKHKGAAPDALRRAIIDEIKSGSVVGVWAKDSAVGFKKAHAILTDFISNGIPDTSPKSVRETDRGTVGGDTAVPAQSSGAGRTGKVRGAGAVVSRGDDSLADSGGRGESGGRKPKGKRGGSGADSGAASPAAAEPVVADKGKADKAGISKPAQAGLMDFMKAIPEAAARNLFRVIAARGGDLGSQDATPGLARALLKHGVEWEDLVNFLNGAYTLATSDAQIKANPGTGSFEKVEKRFFELVTTGESANIKQRLVDIKRIADEVAQAKTPAPAEQARINDWFKTLINRQVASGADVRILKGALANAAVNTSTRQFVYVLEDVTNATFENIVAVFHEGSHDLLAQMTPELRSGALRAASNALRNINDPRAAANANASVEEKLVESLALKLADEGFGTNAPTLAEVWVRAVKDLYFRVARAVLSAFGAQPSDKMMLAWFENSLRRRMGGTYDVRAARMLDAFRPPTRQQQYDSLSELHQGGAPLPDYFDPVTRQFVQPEFIPEVEALGWNLRISGREARARETVAAWRAIMDVTEGVRRDTAPGKTAEQFWKMFTSGDLPASVIGKLDAMIPGVAKATLKDADFTEAMQGKANAAAYGLANRLAYRARRKLATITRAATEAAQQISEYAQRMNKTLTLFRDADATSAMIKDRVDEAIDGLSRDLANGPKAAELVGELAETIRQMESLAKDGPIPEHYQRVLKELRNADKSNLFDYVEAMAKIDMDFAATNAASIATAVRDNAALDPRLAQLAREDNKPLLAALSVFAHKNAEHLYFLNVRRAAATGEYAVLSHQLREIQSASEARLEELETQYGKSLQAKGSAHRLRERYIAAKRQYLSKKRVIQRAEENRLSLMELASRLDAARDEIGKTVGQFSLWRPAHGVTYIAMQQAADGTWKGVERTLAMRGSDVAENYAQLMEDMAWNRQYLTTHAEKLGGTRHFNEVKHQTEQIQLIDFKRQRSIGQMTLLDKLTRDLGDRYANTGELGGQAIHRMLNQLQFIIKTELPHMQALSLRWSKAQHEAAVAAGFKYVADFMDVNRFVQYEIESESGLNEQEAIRHALRAAREMLPASNVVAADFDAKMTEFLRLNKENSENWNRVAEKYNAFVDDRRIKDPLAEGQHLQRHAIKYGWSTTPRHLKGDMVSMLVNGMANWQKFVELLDSDVDYKAALATYFTPDVVTKFVEPFINKPGREVFTGATRKPVDQLLVQQVWEAAGGNVEKFIDGLFFATNEPGSKAVLAEYRMTMLRRFGALYSMMSRIAAEASERTPTLLDGVGNKGHVLMDGRTNEMIPPDFFDYQSFDQVNSRIALAKLAFHGAFGREAGRLEAAMADVAAGINEKARIYTSNKLGAYARADAAAKAKALGYDLKSLERAVNTQEHLGKWRTEMQEYFLYGNSTGAVGDAKTFLELVNLNAGLVLNQPGSALWNTLSVLDFPLAHRGLGPTGVRASGAAMKMMVKDVLGGMLQSWAPGFLRNTEYHAEVGAINDQREVTRLEWGTLMADLGKDGQFQQGGVNNLTLKNVRRLQTAMSKGLGSNSDATTFTGIWSPFRYLSNVVSTAVGTANVQAVELMVKRGLAYYEKTPGAMSDPTFRFTPKMLRMDGTWFSDEPAFKYYRDRLTDYGMGSLEEVIRGAAERKAKGGRLLTKDQVLAVAMMASNEVSLESSINSRPIWMFNNPVWRFGGQLLGWPMTKMQQIADAMKNVETGNYEMKTALKAVGTLALFTLPAGLAFSLAMDQYDEKILRKRSNRRELNPLSIIPGIGPVLAVADGGPNAAYSMLERISRAGTFGLLGDTVASLPAVVDPRSGFRDLDLNTRVLVFNQFANIRDSLRNLWAQSDVSELSLTATYASVGRPMVQTLAGGALQYAQIVNGLLGLDNAEARVTNRINVNNWLRAAGRSAGLEMRPSSAAHATPTPVSVWVREMELACLKNDHAGFLAAYQEAVEAAKRDHSSTTPPNARVLASWKARDPLQRTFATPLDYGQMKALYDNMNDDGKTAVREAINLFARYTNFIELRTEPIRKYERESDFNAIRRKMAAQMMMR